MLVVYGWWSPDSIEKSPGSQRTADLCSEGSAESRREWQDSAEMADGHLFSQEVLHLHLYMWPNGFIHAFSLESLVSRMSWGQVRLNIKPETTFSKC